jgi:hypothetical protein
MGPWRGETAIRAILLRDRNTNPCQSFEILRLFCRSAPAEPPTQAGWNQPAWNPPAWSAAPPEAPRIPAPPGDDRLSSVEPPLGGVVPPAFSGQPEPPQSPPGPVTPPANFALTGGEPQRAPLDMVLFAVQVLD